MAYNYRNSTEEIKRFNETVDYLVRAQEHIKMHRTALDTVRDISRNYQPTLSSLLEESRTQRYTSRATALQAALEISRRQNFTIDTLKIDAIKKQHFLLQGTLNSISNQQSMMARIALDVSRDQSSYLTKMALNATISQQSMLAKMALGASISQQSMLAKMASDAVRNQQSMLAKMALDANRNQYSMLTRMALDASLNQQSAISKIVSDASQMRYSLSSLLLESERINRQALYSHLDRRACFSSIQSSIGLVRKAEKASSVEKFYQESTGDTAYSKETVVNHYNFYQITNNTFNGHVASAQIGNNNNSVAQQSFAEESDTVYQLLGLLHESRDSSLILSDKFRDHAEELIDKIQESAIRFPFGRELVKESINTLARILFTSRANREISYRLLALMKRL